jgi:DNA (cytosine-5)-methyltransferase 1
MLNPANDNDPITFFSVCSGIEAASVAWTPLGWQCVGVSEIEKFPSAVLAHHYPEVKNHGDFTAVDVKTLPRVDILCGGTPCQAFSVAGLRRSLDDARGNLSLSFVRLAHELADNNGLRNVVWENVPGVLSTKDNAFGCFLGALVGADDALIPVEPKPADGKSGKWWRWSKKDGVHQVRWPRYGVVSGPKGNAAWSIKDGQFFGLAQRRERVVLVANFGAGADPYQVLFEPESLPRNTPPSREKGQGFATDVAPSLVSSGRGVARTGDTRGQDPVVAVAFGGNNTAGPIEVATAVNAHGVPHGRLDFESETFVAQPICFSAKDYGADATVGLAPTLRAGGFTDSHANGGVMPAIAHTVAIRGREGGGTAELGGEVATALRASQGGGDKPHVLTSAVRRLTPTECERLQGFPDGYTDIPWRGKPNSPDGPRYKALGNSWAVPKFTWLGRRIAMHMPARQATTTREAA